MRPYLAVFEARTRMLLQYRAAALAGIATQIYWGVVLAAIFTAFFARSAAVQPMSLSQTITYIWLGQAMLALIPWNVESETRDVIRTGSVAYELLRPVDLYGLWYARVAAARFAPLVLRAVPLFPFALLFFGMAPPVSGASASAWLAATLGSLLLGCAITNLVHVSMLFTVDPNGVLRLTIPVVMIFSGSLIPLPLMPEWIQGLVAFLPFGGLIDSPFRLYMGHIPASDAWIVLLHQAVWTCVLVCIGRSALKRGVHTLVIHGG